jgi:hypothetical protein
MEISDDQTDEKSLTNFGAEAVRLLGERQFVEIGNRFGYALAFGRDVAQAIEQDLLRAISQAAKAANQTDAAIKVKYFRPNSIPLFAAVECTVKITDDTHVLMELVVSGGKEKYLSLEQIS